MADKDRDVVDLWQNQTSEGFRMTPEEMQMKVQDLEKKLRTRTLGGYMVCAFVILAFGTWAMIEHDPLMRLGALATIAAVAYLGYQLRQNRFRTNVPAAVATPSIEYLRSELARQRDFHRGKRFWTRMLFLVPAGLLFFFGFARAHPELIRIILIDIVSFLLIAAAAIPLNLRMARNYQRQIDELARQQEGD
jgi:hypothetical protein